MSRTRARSGHLLAVVAVLLIGSGLTAYLSSSWLLRGSIIPSSSMSPTLEPGDRVVFVPADTRLTGIQRGEVVVFNDPGGWVSGGAAHTAEVARVLRENGEDSGTVSGEGLVKRVIGLEGDTVSCCSTGGLIELNGIALTEPYVKGESDQVDFSIRVPENHVFVLGDNRENSDDSRFHLGVDSGTVRDDLVLGRAVVIVQPWRRASWLILPPTFDPVISAGAKDTQDVG